MLYQGIITPTKNTLKFEILAQVQRITPNRTGVSERFSMGTTFIASSSRDLNESTASAGFAA